MLKHYSFISRANPRTPNDHVILGVLGYKPREFANQMNLNLSNGWGIVRTIVDMCLKSPEGKYVLVKDPNKSLLRLYQVPTDTFEEEGSATGIQTVEEADGEDGGA
jgi:translation initiation factor 3 subunit D